MIRVKKTNVQQDVPEAFVTGAGCPAEVTVVLQADTPAEALAALASIDALCHQTLDAGAKKAVEAAKVPKEKEAPRKPPKPAPEPEPEDEDEEEQEDEEEDEAPPPPPKKGAARKPKLTDTLKKAEKLREVVAELIEQGFRTRKDITAAIMELLEGGQVPVIGRISELESRIPRAIELVDATIA